MRTLAMVGCGAIGSSVLELLRGDEAVRVTQVIVPREALDATRSLCARLAPEARVLESLDRANGARPDLLVECAGHGAVAAHVLPALEAGIPAVVASVGALHDADGWLQLEAAATRGGTHASLVSGAIGGIDALSAARLGGLKQVTYIGRKPPAGWKGSPAEVELDLDQLSRPAIHFEGTARKVAIAYPKNANVAAAVALAGTGFDATRVRLIADPAINTNIHEIHATGAFGSFTFRVDGQALPDNPRSSALAAMSVVAAIEQQDAAITI